MADETTACTDKCVSAGLVTQDKAQIASFSVSAAVITAISATTLKPPARAFAVAAVGGAALALAYMVAKYATKKRCEFWCQVNAPASGKDCPWYNPKCW